MPTPNYSFEKRQRELAAKKKKEEKAQKKAAAKHTGNDDGRGSHQEAEATPAPGAPSASPGPA